jgi:hypothetical protein
MNQGIQTERHVSVLDLIRDFGKTSFAPQNRIIRPRGKIQVVSSCGHVTFHEPRYWGDVTVPRIVCSFRMAVPAGSIDDGKYVRADSGTIKQGFGRIFSTSWPAPNGQSTYQKAGSRKRFFQPRVQYRPFKRGRRRPSNNFRKYSNPSRPGLANQSVVSCPYTPRRTSIPPSLPRHHSSHVFNHFKHTG